MTYFTHEEISPHIIRICDLSYTACYLVSGKGKTVLIDTGIGVGSLKQYIEHVIGKHVDEVVLTHGHMDHASGVGEFADVPIYLNEKDRELMRNHCEFANRIDYIQMTQKNKRAEFIKEAVEPQLVPCFDPDCTRNYEDGHLFELGGLTIQAVYVPGHTQGFHMMLLVEERMMLFGDGCGVGVLLIEDCCSCVEDYLQSLLSLKKYESKYDRIIRNHGTYESPKDLLGNVIRVAQEILAGKDDHIETTNIPLTSDVPVYIAKETIPGTQKRCDGLEGNIIYAENKVLRKLQEDKE